MTGPHAEAFLEAARIMTGLLAQDAVTEAWDSPSALPEMSVGALACHLGAQVLNTRRLLAAEPADPAEPEEAELIPLLEHYHRAAWVGSAPEAEVNVGIRAGAAEQAGHGPRALREDVDRALAELPALLAARDGSEPVLIPWQGWRLSVDDLLTTRMMEIVVHADDLACSVALDTPHFPDPVIRPVLDLLGRLAMTKHGQASVVRALARKERAPGDITAF